MECRHDRIFGEADGAVKALRATARDGGESRTSACTGVIARGDSGFAARSTDTLYRFPEAPAEGLFLTARGTGSKHQLLTTDQLLTLTTVQ